MARIEIFTTERESKIIWPEDRKIEKQGKNESPGERRIEKEQREREIHNINRERKKKRQSRKEGRGRHRGCSSPSFSQSRDFFPNLARWKCGKI